MLIGGGGIRLSFRAEPGWNYVIEASTNLVNWSSIGTTTAPAGSVQFDDPDAVRLDRRFYRVVVR